MASASWVGGPTGAWDLANNWSNTAIPTSTTDVSINTASQATVTIQASDTASVRSLTVGSNDTLAITGGSLTAAAGLTNSGTINVAAGCNLTVGGSYIETAAATLSMPGGGDPTFPATNWLGNSDFESPAVPSGSTTTKPGSWAQGGSAYLSTQYAYTGLQSLVMSGSTNSSATQTFTATAGTSYTASAYAMTPASNPLTASAYAELQMEFLNSSGTQVSTWSPPYDDVVFRASSATGGPLPGSVGSQGWNHFWTTAVAPAGTASVRVFVDTHLSGSSGGGTAFFDGITFGPSAAGASKLAAGSVSNSGAVTVGPSNSITTSGTFTQTATGTLDIQFGNTSSSGVFGSIAAGGAATLAGTLKAEILYSYSPSTTDVFMPITFPSESGTFASYALPSGTGYQFAGSVTFTNVVLSAFPTTALTATVNAAAPLQTVPTDVLGINVQYKDQDAVTLQTQQMVTAAGLQMIRIPGGSYSDDWHFNIAYNPGVSYENNFAPLIQFIAAVGATGLATIDYGSASPEEGAAELAYTLGSSADTTTIGNGLEWNDTTAQWQTVDWGTVGYWAALRGASPLANDDGLNFLRISHPAPFANIKYWEVGNEEYGTWETDHHGTAGPGGVSTGVQHDPATYAAFAQQFAALASEITSAADLPGIAIGIDSADPTGASDNNWTKTVVTDGLGDGFVPGFISDHNYMYGSGSENDALLLNHTDSDPASILDWSTRYSDYEAMLQQTLSSQQATSIQILGTEYNSSYSYGSQSSKQSTSLVNGLFLANSIGSLMVSGYQGGCIWDLRDGWSTSENNSPLLYGWRKGGDLGQLGNVNSTSPPSTAAYIPYPGYFALQLASKIVQSGGEVVSAASSYIDLHTYAVLEPSGDLDLLVINTNPAANLTTQFNFTGFQPGGSAQLWQYGEPQDIAQSQTSNGSSALANFATTLSRNGSSFSYTFPAYSMTVVDLTTAPTASGPSTATVGHGQALSFRGANTFSVYDPLASGATIDAVVLSVNRGTLNVNLSGGASIRAGINGSANLTLSGTVTQLNAALGTLTYTAPTTGTGDTLTITATDGSQSGTPLTTIIALVGVPSHLVFGQQPSNAAVPGSPLRPAVTVQVFDQYGNLVTSDNSDQVTLSLGANAGGASLGGTWVTMVTAGIATFNNLCVNQPGSGYALVATCGTMTVTSASFDIAGVIDGFETNAHYTVVGAAQATASTSTMAAHDGSYGFVTASGNDWMYRSDAAAQVQQGDTISVWMEFPILADGRAYFTFGSSSAGTLSLVAAPNTNQLILQNNNGWGFLNLATAPQTWLTDHWYRLEIDWGTTGSIVGKLFDSDGATLLNSVTGSTTVITSGGFGFRSLSGSVFWDTVQLTPGGDQPILSGSASSAASSAMAASASVPTEDPLTQTIAFDPIGDRCYGDTIPLAATASSGLPVSFTVVSGPATILGNTLTVIGLGTVTVEAAQPGNADYLAAESYLSFQADPAPLTITADDRASVYGSTLPALTASYAGFVNGDTPASLAMLPTFSTSATTGSDVGSYAIAVGRAADVDYTITYVSGTLTVLPAPSTITADDQGLSTSRLLVGAEPQAPSPGTTSALSPTSTTSAMADAVDTETVEAIAPSVAVVAAAVSDSSAGTVAHSTITTNTVASASCSAILQSPAPVAVTPSRKAAAQGTVLPPSPSVSDENAETADASSPAFVPTPFTPAPGARTDSPAFRLPPSAIPLLSPSKQVLPPLTTLLPSRLVSSENSKDIGIAAHSEPVGRLRLVASAMPEATNARGPIAGFSAAGIGNFQPLRFTIADLAILEMFQDTADRSSAIAPTAAVDEQFSAWGMAAPPLFAAIPPAVDRTDLSSVAEQSLETLIGSVGEAGS